MVPVRTGGFSLFEVLVAVAVLAACAVLFAQIASFSRLGIEKLQYRTQALLFCQSKMSEIVSGAEPLESVDKKEMPGQPGWFYSVRVERLESDGLVSVSVRTWAERTSTRTEADSAAPVLAEAMLVRWVRDPERPALSRRSPPVVDESEGEVSANRSPDRGRPSERTAPGRSFRRFGTGLDGQRGFRRSRSQP